MKKLFLFILGGGLLLAGCKDDEGPEPPVSSNFTIKIENVSMAKSFFASGSVPGLLMPDESQEFTFEAGPGAKLSLATMLVQSNDLFFAPGEAGIDLYNGNTRVTGDVSDQIDIWDAGTEVNEEPGVGANQAPRQSGPNTGDDENGVVQLVANAMDGFTYPDASDLIQVSIEASPMSDTGFKVVVTNVSSSSTLATPMAGLIWVVHTTDGPLFTDGMADAGNGLESIAEDGDATSLTTFLGDDSGLVSPLSPGVWAVHDNGVNPIFVSGQADLGEGLEAIAEDGDPSGLAGVLTGKAGVSSSGVFNTPTGASAPGPALPGGAYEFSITANDGDYLSFVSMFVQSNDLFFAAGDGGIPLFSGGNPISGEVSTVALYDAGTEVNEFPGAGLNQVIRQAGPNTGVDEGGVVANINTVSDGFSYPAVGDVIRVTITSN
ncbi:MAG: spondin domain-containing protein [Cyclobacteriaceae bacterium]